MDLLKYTLYYISIIWRKIQDKLIMIEIIPSKPLHPFHFHVQFLDIAHSSRIHPRGSRYKKERRVAGHIVGHGFVVAIVVLIIRVSPYFWN